MLLRLFLIGGVVLGVAGTASAQEPVVVVLDFGGTGGSTARVQVLRALNKYADFEKKSDAEAIAARKRLKLNTDAGREELADRLDVDYIFWGKVRGRGASARTEIRVAGRSGEQITGYEAGAPGTREGNNQIQEAAKTALSEAMDASPPKKRKGKEAGTVVVAPVVVGDTDEPKKKKKRKKKKKASGTDALPVFTILATGGIRLLDIQFDVGLPAGGTDPRRLDTGAYFDLGGHFQVRPWGRSSSKALQGLVIEGDGGWGRLKAQQQGVGGENEVTTWRALGQVGYLYPVKGLLVGALTGVGVDTFDIEVNSILPSRQYVYYRFGPAIAYRILKDTLMIRAEGGIRKPFSLGDLDALGSTSEALGFDVSATIGGRLDMGLAYGFRFIWERYNVDFSGATQNDGLEPSIGGDGTDTAMTFQFMVGWSL